jgi:hypothetical protein
LKSAVENATNGAVHSLTVECLHCGRPFEPRKAGHVFCCVEHRHAGERRPEDRRWSDPDRYAQLFGDDRPADLVLAAFKVLADDPSGGEIALVAEALRASGDSEIYELFGIGPEPIPDAPFERDRAEAVEGVAEAAGADSFAALDLYTEMVRPGWSPFPVREGDGEG